MSVTLLAVNTFIKRLLFSPTLENSKRKELNYKCLTLRNPCDVLVCLLLTCKSPHNVVSPELIDGSLLQLRSHGFPTLMCLRRNTFAHNVVV